MLGQFHCPTGGVDAIGYIQWRQYQVWRVPVQAIEGDIYSLIIVNFANGDMVGHTAVPDAIIKALEVMDKEVGRVLDSAVRNKMNVLLTSDHGNCDEMVDPITGEPHTRHTLYPVPFLLLGEHQIQLGSLLDS